MDDFDDPELAAALRRRAADLTAGSPATDAAYVEVRRRSRRRRAWRAGTVGAAAAAAAIGALALAGATDGRPVVRTPATAPPTAPVTTPVTAPTTVATTDTTLVTGPPPTSPPTDPTDPSVTTTPPAPTTPTSAAPPPTEAVAPPPATTTRTFSVIGGSITVQQAGGAIALSGDPRPTAGYTVRIDDDGPSRVRVRFDSGDLRTEIRVDLVDGAMVPQITEQ